MRSLAAEFLGTFLLVFAGTGAIVTNSTWPGTVGPAGVALTFGLVVAVGIFMFAETSGAHFNPAVTIGLALAGRFAWSAAPAYLATQCAGAVSASLALRGLFPADQGLGTTVPTGGVNAAFWFEVVMTFILVATILASTAHGSRFAALAPIAIGGAVALDALFGGPVSGASMNPARSLGPALVTGIWTSHWLYWLAPVTGAMLAALVYLFLHPKPSRPDEEA